MTQKILSATTCKSICAVALSSLLASTAMAGSILIDIDPNKTLGEPGDVELIVGSSNIHYQRTLDNSGAITDTAGGDDSATRAPYSINVGDIDGVQAYIRSNAFDATAGANANGEQNNLFNVVLGAGSVGDAEALIGVFNNNTGTVSSAVQFIDTQITAANVLAGGSTEIAYNRYSSTGLANGTTNVISGDMTAQTDLGVTGEATVDPAAVDNTVTAIGDVAIATAQVNSDTGTVTSLADDINAYISLTSLGDASGEGDTSTITGNVTDVRATANSLINEVAVDSSGKGLSYAIAALQNNAGAVTGTIDDVKMYQQITGDFFGDVSTTNNQFSVSASSNVMNNTLTIASAGGDGGSFDSVLHQNSSAAVSSSADLVNLSVTAGSAGGSTYEGSLEVSNNAVSANSSANVIVNDFNISNLGDDHGSNIEMRQINSGAVTSGLTNVDLSITAGISGGTDTFSGDMSVANNALDSTASANVLYSEIDYHGNSGGSVEHASLYSSFQSNTGAVTAGVTGAGIDMSITVHGTVSGAGGIGVSNNSVTSTAVANAVSSIIRRH